MTSSTLLPIVGDVCTTSFIKLKKKQLLINCKKGLKRIDSEIRILPVSQRTISLSQVSLMYYSKTYH